MGNHQAGCRHPEDSAVRQSGKCSGELLLVLSLDRDLDVYDKIVAAIDAVSVDDIDEFAKNVFVESNRVIVTMSHGAEEAR